MKKEDGPDAEPLDIKEEEDKKYELPVVPNQNTDDDQITNVVRKEMLRIQELKLVYQLLQHYYTMANNKTAQSKFEFDDTPLRRLYCPYDTDDKKQSQAISEGERITKDDTWDIRFLLNRKEYKLSWWNQKGKYEPNAFAIINITLYESRKDQLDLKHVWENDPATQEELHSLLSSIPEEKQPLPIEICYIRFESNPEKDDIEWLWYDRHSDQYIKFDASVFDELEASFLSNIKHNFDPVEFDQKFNNCLLPILTSNLNEKSGNNFKTYAFHATFLGNYVITNMEQLSFDMIQSSPSSRSIKRQTAGSSSLDLLFADYNNFLEVCGKSCFI